MRWNGTYCYEGACETSIITGTAPVGAYNISDNRIYNYSPYIDYNGIGYLISPAQPLPGTIRREIYATS